MNLKTSLQRYVSFLNYANIASSNSKINNKVKKIEQKYLKYGFTSWSNVVMASDINTENYTKLPFEYENKYLYHYIFNLSNLYIAFFLCNP